MTTFSNDDVAIENGTLSTVSSSDGGTTFTATLTPSVSTTAPSNVISVTMTGVADTVGNAGSGTTNSNIYAIDTKPIDTTAPVISGVSSQSLDGTYVAGDTITIDVAFVEAVIVTGTPQITLETGPVDRVASYSSGSGSLSLSFTYTVQAGDSSADLDYISAAALALNLGTIKDGAGNDATLTLPALGSGSLGSSKNLVIDTTADTATPATEFASKAAGIRQTLADEATRGLTSALSANLSMMPAAKGRFVSGADQNAALDVDGSFNANPVSLSTMGTFFGQAVTGKGARRLIFGTFDVQRDDETGASTASFNGKVAWERSLSDTTMLGYFIGGDLGRSNLAGSFTGDQDHLGISLGGYAVHKLAKELYLDGFVSLGAGRNNLTMSDDVLVLKSGYTTCVGTFGASLSGRIAQKGYEIWPELALSVGRTWIDTMAFTGTAFGVTDTGLSLDAGMVTLANLTFRPEFRVPLDGLLPAQSQQLLTFAPRVTCQQVTAADTVHKCGRGAEFGIQSHSPDGMTSGVAKIQVDWINGQTSNVAQLSLEHRF